MASRHFYIIVFMSIWGMCVLSDREGHKGKRILFSDPDYVQQQLTHLQSELQTLQINEVATQNKLQLLQTNEAATQNKLQLLQTTVQKQNEEITYLKTQLATTGGSSTFVRWGRKDCPSNVTNLVYSGYAGGSWWDSTGAAANYVCLPRDPVWGPYKDIGDDYSGRMYGAEYESNSGHTPFGPHSRDEDVPCAVCRSQVFSSSIMIPGRTECYSGWTEAYRGSLASGYYNHKAATSYVCVDEQPQPLDGGGASNDNGVLFFGVRAMCGSLRCPPYEQDKLLSCVVCLK